MFFKVYLKQIKDGEVVSECRMEKDYAYLKTAMREAKEHLLTPESEYCIREYANNKVNICCGDYASDTGNVVVNWTKGDA